jgi:hypothetical protein
MQLHWLDHFREIVIPSWQDYLESEVNLSVVAAQADRANLMRASYSSLRRGACAAIFLHHFADVVLRERPPILTSDAGIASARSLAKSQCTFHRSATPCRDVALLKHVADALKHCELTHGTNLPVSQTEAVLVATSIHPIELPAGERKEDHSPEVAVLTITGPRALSSILQNVVDAWRRVAGLPLPPIGQP